AHVLELILAEGDDDAIDLAGGAADAHEQGSAGVWRRPRKGVDEGDDPLVVGACDDPVKKLGFHIRRCRPASKNGPAQGRARDRRLWREMREGPPEKLIVRVPLSSPSPWAWTPPSPVRGPASNASVVVRRSRGVRRTDRSNRIP